MSQLGDVITGAIQGGAAGGKLGAVIGGLGGLFSSIDIGGKRKKLRQRIAAKESEIRFRIPGVESYFDELEEFEKKKIDTKKNNVLDNFIRSTLSKIPTVEQAIASTNIEASGAQDRIMTSTRGPLQSGLEQALSKIDMEEDDRMLAIEKDRQNQISSLLSQIDALELRRMQV